MPSKGAKERACERRIRALELRKAGASYRQIAKTLDVSVKTAFADIRATLAEISQREQALGRDLVALDLERLDDALRAIWVKVKAGDLAAIDRLLAISKRRADMLGLDAPSRQEVRIDWTAMTDEQLRRLADGEDPRSVMGG